MKDRNEIIARAKRNAAKAEIERRRKMYGKEQKKDVCAKS